MVIPPCKPHQNCLKYTLNIKKGLLFVYAFTFYDKAVYTVHPWSGMANLQRPPGLQAPGHEARDTGLHPPGHRDSELTRLINDRSQGQCTDETDQ